MSAKRKSKAIQTIVTGDIVSSRTIEQNTWLPILEKAIQGYSSKYDIFRGDSFQIQLQIEDVFECVFYLKASLKAIGLDVRIGIGVGTIEHDEDTIKKSSGEAFVFSGNAFDELGKETLSIKSEWTELDTTLNLMLQLATEIADRWTMSMAHSIAIALSNPTINQKELAKLLNQKYQSQISTKLGNAGFQKIKRVIQYATNELIKRC
ncbi:SatD family protein [Sphingobacterium hungaricum]|uniref:SatD family (SatD) n=1 Tax=Sphingobacterium hungaricum TaxID=2082723 RepID=A0A928YT71_9SPHI|nr:SatD family protein [Sphingobacterium hungaricum]MBE8714898.1 hypothetical protein [Sphingobacterium hungaricum]